MQRYHCLAGVCLLLLSFVFPTSAFSNGTRPVNSDKDQLVLGLLPFVSPERLTQRFEPLARHLSRALDVDVVLETAPDYREFVRRTAKEKRYDLLFTAPHFYYLAQRNGGYRVAVRVSGAPMDAVIVTPKTSPIYHLKDLSGRKLATPASLALGTLLVRERLATSDGDLTAEITLVETPTHNASLMSTINSFTDAASLMTPVFDRMAPDIKDEFRVIAKTSSTPHMPFSVAPWVSVDRGHAFTEAMVNMRNSEEGRSLLKHLGWPGFVEAKPNSYDVFGSFAEMIKVE
jgi:phosphonate transport system substrate-binding protein